MLYTNTRHYLFFVVISFTERAKLSPIEIQIRKKKNLIFTKTKTNTKAKAKIRPKTNVKTSTKMRPNSNCFLPSSSHVVLYCVEIVGRTPIRVARGAFHLKLMIIMMILMRLKMMNIKVPSALDWALVILIGGWWF